MGRISSFPTLLNDCSTISISELRLWGYLRKGKRQGGTITWKRSGSETGSISFVVDMQIESPYLQLNYLSDGNPISYRVKLITIPSNIGNGVIWYFLCPKTGKRCRKLYLVNSFFLHRSAISGCLYENQTYSHKIREKVQYFQNTYGIEAVYDELDSKYFKNFYNGKPTKRYLFLIKKITLSKRLLNFNKNSNYSNDNFSFQYSLKPSRLFPTF